VLTDLRLFVFDAGRTAAPRAILAEFPINEITVGEVVPGSLGITRFVLELPGLGRVPFEAGRREQREAMSLPDLLASSP
jgi:hypothetical protein